MRPDPSPAIDPPEPRVDPDAVKCAADSCDEALPHGWQEEYCSIACCLSQRRRNVASFGRWVAGHYVDPVKFPLTDEEALRWAPRDEGSLADAEWRDHPKCGNNGEPAGDQGQAIDHENDKDRDASLDQGAFQKGPL